MGQGRWDMVDRKWEGNLPGFPFPICPYDLPFYSALSAHQRIDACRVSGGDVARQSRDDEHPGWGIPSDRVELTGESSTEHRRRLHLTQSGQRIELRGAACRHVTRGSSHCGKDDPGQAECQRVAGADAEQQGA
jgi:hypothetical protein